MDFLAQLLGLPLLAGVNPWATAFVIGFLRRQDMLRNSVLLTAPFTPFAQDGWLVFFGAAALMHSLADKIPAVNHLNDAVHTLVKPLAGAFLSLALVNAVNPDRSLPFFVTACAVFTGTAAAASVHAVRSTTRLAVSKLSFGFLTPVASLVDDVAAVGGTVFAVRSPVLFLLVALGVGTVFVLKMRALWRQVRPR